MARGKDPAAIEDGPPADVGQARYSVHAAGIGEIVRPQWPAGFHRQRVKLTRRISRHDDLAFDGGAGAPQQACRFRNCIVVPEAPPVIGGKHDQFVVDGDHKDPSIRNRRPTAHRAGNGASPDDPAVCRIEREDLRITGRDVETVVPVGNAAAKRSAALVVGLEIELPNPVAGRGIDRADLDPPVHGVDPALGDHRLRQHSRIAGSPLADAGAPRLGEGVRQREVLHRMVRVPAWFRPLRVDHGRRQRDRDFRQVRIRLELSVEAENGNTLPRQWLLLVTEQVAPSEPE